MFFNDYGDNYEYDQEIVAVNDAPRIFTFLSSISMPFYLLHQQVPAFNIYLIYHICRTVSFHSRRYDKDDDDNNFKGKRKK